MNDFVELRYIINIILKWFWLLIIGLLLGATISYAYSIRQTPVYEATATILVGQSIQAPDLSSSDIRTSELLALTYADIARRQPVLQGVVEALGIDKSWQTIKSQVKISPVAETQLLEITVEDSSPELAQGIANEIANQLVLISPTTTGNRESEAIEFVNEQIVDLQNKIEAGQARIREIEAIDVSTLPDAEREELVQQAALLETNITNWQSNYTRLLSLVETQNTLNNISIVESALLKSTPIRPRLELNTLIGAMLGFSATLVFIFLREYLDDTFKSQGDVSQTFNLPPVGNIGAIKGNSLQDKLITTENYFASSSEAYRMMRSNIQFMSVERPLQTIIVTSPSVGDGKSTTVANLGVVMAQAANRTIIVDANLRNPAQHLIFQKANGGGWTDLLLSPNLEVKDCLVDTPVENLKLLSCGDLPPNPTELLGSARMTQLVEQLRQEADVIIFDSPSVVSFTDAFVLSNLADLVLLVINLGKTSRDTTRQAVFNLMQLEKIRLGTVLNQSIKPNKNPVASLFYK